MLGQIDEELIPTSDRGFVLIWTQAPEGSTIEYMDRYQKSTEDLVRALPEVRHVFSVIALGLGTPGLVNQGLVITSLSPEEDRERSQDDIASSMSTTVVQVFM